MRDRAILPPAGGDVKPCLHLSGICAPPAAAGRALGGRVQTTREQRIVLFEEMRFAEPLTPVVLASGTVRLLPEAQPFLDLLAQVVEPPVAAGHANVQEV